MPRAVEEQRRLLDAHELAWVTLAFEQHQG